MKRRGFTLIEVLIVLTIIGIMLAVGIPTIGSQTSKGQLRSAMDAFSTMHAVAKQSAIQRGRQSRLVIDASEYKVIVLSRNAAGTAWDTLRAESMSERFGVRFTTTRDTLVFSPRGIGGETSGTTVILIRGELADTLTISAAGRLMR
jgi:type II secretion system protein H